MSFHFLVTIYLFCLFNYSVAFNELFYCLPANKSVNAFVQLAPTSEKNINSEIRTWTSKKKKLFNAKRSVEYKTLCNWKFLVGRDSNWTGSSVILRVWLLGPKKRWIVFHPFFSGNTCTCERLGPGAFPRVLPNHNTRFLIPNKHKRRCLPGVRFSAASSSG